MPALKSLALLALASGLSSALPQLAPRASDSPCSMQGLQEFDPIYQTDAEKYHRLETYDDICKGKDSGEWTFTFLVDSGYSDAASTDAEGHKSTAVVLDDSCKIMGLYEFTKDCGSKPDWKIYADFFKRSGSNGDLTINKWKYHGGQNPSVDYAFELNGKTYERNPGKCDLIIGKWEWDGIDLQHEYYSLMSCAVTFSVSSTTALSPVLRKPE